MKKQLIYLILITGLLFAGLSCSHNERLKPGAINISWTTVQGDFSFKERWNYPEGVFKNDFGQLSCDGLCPPETEQMKEVDGRIYEDSLSAFYRLVDTSHQFHSIESEAWTYEWAGTDFMTATRIHADTLICYTQQNAATHCSLVLTITKDKCIPKIELNSIAGPGDTKTYTCKKGQIEIDKDLWRKGILKATFDFTFDHKENPSQSMYWKGKIYTSIKPHKESSATAPGS